MPLGVKSPMLASRNIGALTTQFWAVVRGVIFIALTWLRNALNQKRLVLPIQHKAPHGAFLAASGGALNAVRSKPNIRTLEVQVGAKAPDLVEPGVNARA